MNKNVFIMDHPLIQHKLTILRDERTGSKQFRELVSEIATLMCFEATRDLPLKDVKPLQQPRCLQVKKWHSYRFLGLVLVWLTVY